MLGSMNFAAAAIAFPKAIALAEIVIVCLMLLGPGSRFWEGLIASAGRKALHQVNEQVRDMYPKADSQFSIGRTSAVVWLTK